MPLRMELDPPGAEWLLLINLSMTNKKLNNK